MKTRIMRVCNTTALVFSLTVFGFIWSFPCDADPGGRHLEGSWMATVTAVNLPELPSFKSLITIIPGGGVVESRRLYLPASPLGPILETTGHGEWVKSGDHNYVIVFTFLMQGAPDHPDAAGAFLGTDNITLRVQLAPSGDELSGEFESEIRDPDGNFVFGAYGPATAVRIKAEP